MSRRAVSSESVMTEEGTYSRFMDPGRGAHGDGGLCG